MLVLGSELHAGLFRPSPAYLQTLRPHGRLVTIMTTNVANIMAFEPIMEKALNIMKKAPNIMVLEPNIMGKAPNIVVFEPNIMEKAPNVMVLEPNIMVFKSNIMEKHRM